MLWGRDDHRTSVGFIKTSRPGLLKGKILEGLEEIVVFFQTVSLLWEKFDHVYSDDFPATTECREEIQIQTSSGYIRDEFGSTAIGPWKNIGPLRCFIHVSCEDRVGELGEHLGKVPACYVCSGRFKLVEESQS